MPPVAPPLAEQCFTIFEGGGAKGITHLGALKALETVGLARIGTAGTSAGAIVAALTAVGYTADELFRTGADNILARRKLTPIDLLGSADWRIFSGVARSAPNLAMKLMRALLVLMPPLVPLWVFSLARTAGRPKRFALAWRVIDDLGFFTTEAARDILDELLRNKLGFAPDRPVCFRDIDPTIRPSCCRLKIITTNLGLGGLELFDHSTPDVVVADAVAASFSIPIFFKPTKIRRCDAEGRQSDLPDRYADGGLVSNLPVWVFLEDKRIVERAYPYQTQRPLPVIAFRLGGEKGRVGEPFGSPVARLLEHARRVMETGIFGGQPIAENFVTHLTTVRLPTSLGVVQFDCTAADAEAAYASGFSAATDALSESFREGPSHRLVLLRELIDEATRLSATIRTDGSASSFRAYVVRQLGNRSFKVIAAANMDKDTDDDLVLDEKNPGAPTAFKDRDITYVDIKSAQTDLRMTKYEKALLRPTLTSLIAVPIFDSAELWRSRPPDRPTPIGVVCLDSDDALEAEFASREFIRMLVDKTVKFARYTAYERMAT